VLESEVLAVLEFSRYANKAFRKFFENKLTYGIYERVLWRQIKDGPKPEHVGIILDGNRRWASEHGLPAWVGHEAGANKIEDLLDWCWKLGIKAITIYVFSTENFTRSKMEIDEIMRLALLKLRKILDDGSIHKNRVHIKAIGRIDLLPDQVKDLIQQAEEVTKNYDQFYLNIAIAYGGRAELVDAMRKIAKEIRDGVMVPEQIDEEVIEKHLYTAYLPKSDPDLIVRTSGEERLSNFLLWQSAYSELLFLDVFWPDFRHIDLWRAVRTYQRRRRRFGR
jgi:tritrans,polycis-undecaprenyl-diphosphate synthase [geranylgeranyl-diphosphate specific]